jgi:chitodextrinase
VTGATTTSITTSWTASTDNVAVTGYHLFLDGLGVATTSATGFTFAGLTCGTNHTLAVEAFDAAGNASVRPSITAFTASCPDTTPPSTPTAFAKTAATTTSITTSWTASTDNVGVTGYHLFLDGTNVATTSALTFTFASLTCGTSHTLAVEAFDASGNLSTRPSITATTAACADTTPPQVALTAPAAGATVSASVQVTASATDAGGIASVQFTLDGANLGAALTSAPYTLAWDSLGVANGSHTLSARATDTAGNAATAATVAVTVQNTLNGANAFKRVDIGPGYVDASLRSIIRTSGGRVYAFVADDTAERKGTGPGVIHAYRADQTGIPTSFTEVDAIHRPSATGTTHVVGSPDVRLAANGVAHMVYTDETDATLWYETFSTVTDTWGPRVSLATGVDIPTNSIKREASNALVLDASDVPHVAYAGGSLVQYRNRAGGVWSTARTISSGGTPKHVALAAAPDGTIDLTWLQDGAAPTISFAQRSSAGTWSAPETVAGSDVLSNSNSDQGPSVAVDSTNRPLVLYVSASKGIFGPPAHPAGYGAIQIKQRIGGVWTFDNPTPDALTHTPQIYMRGNDIYAFLGHDTQLRFGYQFQPGGQPWGAYTALTTTAEGTFDGSASLRWDPLHETNAGVIDAAFWDEDILDNGTFFAEAYYMAVLPAAPGSADTTAPTATLTAPAAGATVSGTAVAVSANATDNIGVAGVQFKLDGANLGAEDTTAPYSLNWDSTAVANGSHTLSAVARDAAGNTATAASVTVTTSNVGAPPPPPPGTVLLGNAATEANIDSNAAGQAEAFKTTAALSGSVTRLRIFVDASSTAGSVAVGLYTNSATGHPGTLLTTGRITAPAVGQSNEVAVTAAAVTAGQTYWIAVLGPTGTLKFRDRVGVGAGNAETSSQATLASLPATWTTGATFADGFLSAVGVG